MKRKRFLVLSFAAFLGIMVLSVTASAGSGSSEGLQAYESRDYSKAAALYKKSCDGEVAKGCVNLGSLYANGQGVEQNKIKAYQYWMEAAKMGNTGAQHNLGILCRQNPEACKEK